MAAPTLNDLATHLNVTVPTGGDAVEMQQHLDAAVAYVERRTRPFVARTLTVYAVANNRYLTLPAKYVTAVTSLTDPAGRAVDLTVYPGAVNLEAGVISLPYLYPGIWSPWIPGRWAAVIVVGDNSPPADLLLAALFIAGHFWASQRGGFGPPSGGSNASQAFAIPNRAVELMSDYEMNTFA